MPGPYSPNSTDMAFNPDTHDFTHSAVRIGTKVAKTREEYDALTKAAGETKAGASGDDAPGAKKKAAAKKVTK